MKQKHGRNAYDHYLSRRYFRNALVAARNDGPLAAALLDWINSNFDETKDIGAGSWEKRFEKKFGPRRERDGFPRGRARAFLKTMREEVEASLRPAPPASREAEATGVVARRFRLDESCHALLELARIYRRRGPVETFRDAVQESHGNGLDATATVLGISRTAVEKGLRRLSALGLADASAWGAEGAEPRNYTDDWLDRIYEPPVRDEDELGTRIAPLASEPLLELEDFDHLGEREDAFRLLSAAVEKRESARILLYGRAGTGKTQFSKALAKAASGRAHDISGGDDPRERREESTSRDSDSPAAYRNRLRAADVLLRSDPEAVILCDEAEDLLQTSEGRRRHSLQLLEELSVPAIFTVNSLEDFDEALLRRFDLTIRFKAHSPSRRRSVALSMVRKSGLDSLDESSAESLAGFLADDLECPPGLIEPAIRSSRLIGGSAEDIRRFAERHERTVSCQIARPRLGPPVRAQLPWKAFGHLGDPGKDVLGVFRNALDARRRGDAAAVRGVSFLAYGPPGCGKTEFCHSLAAEAGATLYSVGKREQGTDARLTVARPVSLRFACEALADEPGAFLLFDELEEILDESKQWLNDLLEQAPVPILFTANEIEVLRMVFPQLLDRFTLSLEFRNLSAATREEMFRGILTEKSGVPSPEFVRELAANPRITPRQVGNAARVAAFTGGGEDALRRSVEQKSRLRRGSRVAEAKPVENYDFSLVSADRDLADLADRVVALGPRRMGILLDGPSGTGKSEFAKQLAKRMGMDPMVRRASDLLSKWVGENEQNIARMFAEARERRAFLILDEADSLLGDRRDHVRSWETSQANELLSQLEVHDLPYVFTTNLRDRLDPAVARRFLFHATFDYLDRPRVARAWEVFFGGEAPPAVLDSGRLTPADFALVRERAEVLGFLEDRDRLTGELAIQTAGRESKKRPGFAGYDAGLQRPGDSPAGTGDRTCIISKPNTSDLRPVAMGSRSPEFATPAGFTGTSRLRR